MAKKILKRVSDYFGNSLTERLSLYLTGIKRDFIVVGKSCLVSSKDSLLVFYDFSSDSARTYITFEYDLKSKKILDKKEITIRHLIPNKKTSLEVTPKDEEVVKGLVAKLQKEGIELH